MIDLTCDNTVYDNLIEYYFHEFFEINNIDISGLNYKQVPNSTYSAAFGYVYKKLFKPSKPQVNNKKTLIDLDNLTELNYVFDCYIDLIQKYNIVGFQNMFINLTGISKDTINSWLRCEYNHDGLSQEYSDYAKRVNSVAGSQVQNKLGDDRIGIQSLANNDSDVGLLYARQEAYNKALGDSQARVKLSDLCAGLPVLENNS